MTQNRPTAFNSLRMGGTLLHIPCADDKCLLYYLFMFFVASRVCSYFMLVALTDLPRGVQKSFANASKMESPVKLEIWRTLSAKLSAMEALVSSFRLSSHPVGKMRPSNESCRTRDSRYGDSADGLSIINMVFNMCH
jgi:hypothetical protein